jgi:enoyl-[acyl-carrier-protein] reductase (NADH)
MLTKELVKVLGSKKNKKNTLFAGPLASRAASAIQRKEGEEKFIDAYIRCCF